MCCAWCANIVLLAVAQVMKARGASQPVTVDDIVRITTTDGTCIDWPDKRKRSLANVSIGSIPAAAAPTAAPAMSMQWWG